MKFAFSLLVSALASVSAATIEVGDTLKASSAMGRDLLSKARRLENDGQNNEMQWMGDYSLKFQGAYCL